MLEKKQGVGDALGMTGVDELLLEVEGGRIIDTSEINEVENHVMRNTKSTSNRLKSS